MVGVSNEQLKELRKSPCWEWPATISYDGYAKRMIKGAQKTVHKVVYEALIGDVPKGLVSDHLCRNRKCVNPFHLEIVTIKENTLRGFSQTAMNARKTHCKRGHELSGDNVKIIQKEETVRRECRECRKKIHARYNKKKTLDDTTKALQDKK